MIQNKETVKRGIFLLVSNMHCNDRLTGRQSYLHTWTCSLEPCNHGCTHLCQWRCHGRPYPTFLRPLALQEQSFLHWAPMICNLFHMLVSAPVASYKEIVYNTYMQTKKMSSVTICIKLCCDSTWSKLGVLPGSTSRIVLPASGLSLLRAASRNVTEKPGYRFSIMFCRFIYTSSTTLTVGSWWSQLDSHGSSPLQFKLKLMVWYFVRDSEKVMTMTFVVLLSKCCGEKETPIINF
jgi:hypothetical protein